MTKLTDNQLVETISTNLTKVQDRAIKLVQQGRSNSQSLEPTISLTHAQIKKLTGRSRIRSGFVSNFIELLQNEWLEVRWSEEGEVIHITKPAECVETQFESLSDLVKEVGRHTV